MQPHALRVIHDEHGALAALLQSLPMLLRLARREGRVPDFAVLRAMLLYVDEFPERHHHPKEDALLFPRVRRLAPETAPALDRLAQEHAYGERRIRDLQHALLAWEVLGEPRRDAFEAAAQHYADFYLAHMALEEQVILPAALRHFSADDWAVLDAAFAGHPDPRGGGAEAAGDDDAQAVWRPLFSRIVATAPAPVGLG